MPSRNDEELRSLFTELLSKIRTEEDPIELNAYRALVRKNVPFFMRSYFMAYLFMNFEKSSPKGRRGRIERSNKAPREEIRKRSQTAVEAEPRKTESPRRVLPADEAATLFVSAGRNRRAYARELLSLLCTNDLVSKDDIGELRVLDNFSFVQVRRTVADEVISALNGREFRGRPLSVSYAKPRKEEDTLSPDSSSDPEQDADVWISDIDDDE
ncbi:hypothetical protein MASR2M78_09140 [Treponema sp.]